MQTGLPKNWLMMNGDYGSTRYSKLKCGSA